MRDINGRLLKMFDLIQNGWAGDSNPQKYCLYIGNTSNFIKALSFNGTEVNLMKSSHRVKILTSCKLVPCEECEKQVDEIMKAIHDNPELLREGE